jgi:type I protein arginine methyltransferase
VYAIEPKDLLADSALAWDSLAFNAPIVSRRTGQVAWRPRATATIHGFALWWHCTLAPGIVLSTSPYAPRTHWDQIYLPVLESLAVQAGDELTLRLECETGGAESGIEVRWTVGHRRDGEQLAEQRLSIGAGYLG